MARQFLTGLDLNQNELINAQIQNLATDPAGGVEGQVYYNTAAHEIRVYNGTLWEAVGLNGVTADASEINILDGATLTTAELNILAGATLTTAELNTLDGITATVNELNILDGATVTFTELNILDGALISTADLNSLTGITGNVQDQLDLLAPISNPTFTGTVSLATDLVFEGATADDNETTVRATDPTQDNLITLPDSSGTVILDSNTVNDLTAPTSSFSMNSQTITNLADPVNATDAATKQYVDAARSGLDVKQSVRLATTTTDGNIDLTGATPTTSIDGVALADGDRVLIKHQTDASENGLYVYSSADDSYTRTTDADSDAEVTPGLFTFIEEGTENGDSGYVLSTNGTIVLGTTDLVFSQFSGTGQITAGDGLTKDGNIINAIGTADRITVTSDAIDIASTYVGQSSITTLGTITTGEWQATDIAVAHGGTGASTAADARANLGATTKHTEANTLLTATGGQVSWTVTHNLGIRTVLVQVYDLSTYEEVEVDIARTDTNTVTLSWVSSSDVSADSYQVVIVG